MKRIFGFLIALQVVTLGCEHNRPSSSSAFWKHIEFAILEDYDKGADLRVVERDFVRFQELGIRTWRGSFGWDDYEPQARRYDFAWLHQFCDLAERHGIRLRPYIAYTPEWAAAGRTEDGAFWNDPPSRLSDWSAFVGTLAGELARHRNILSYEIYNEENVKEWWDGSTDEYRAVLGVAAARIREAAPGTAVILGGMVWPDHDWVEGLCTGIPGGIDAIPFHAYPETWTPDSVRVENFLPPTFQTDFIPAADSSCGTLPIWLNETGCATTPGKSEAFQAAWWVRTIATYAAMPRISLIGVYEIKDLPVGSAAIGDSANFHLGLLRVDRTPKIAFQTVRFLAGFLSADSVRVDNDAAFVRGEDASRVQAHCFQRPDGERLLALWSTQGRAIVEVRLRDPARSVTETTLDGVSHPVPGFQGTRFENVVLEDREPRLFVLQEL